MSDEERPRGLSRKEEGKAKVGEAGYDDDDQTGQRNKPGPGSGNPKMSDEERPRGLSRKEEGKAKVGEADYDDDDQTGPGSGNPKMSDEERPRGLSRKEEGKAKVGEADYDDDDDHQTGLGNPKMSDEERPRGLSRKEKGKAKVGEEDYDDDDDDDQIGQRNGPGPGSGDGSYSPLGPLVCFCFSKTLTSYEVNPKGPVLYLDYYETRCLLDSPDINSVSLPMKLYVFDIQRNLYTMLLSPCARSGWTGYSITAGWGIFVSYYNLVPGDKVSFHRSRDIDSYHILVKKSDKLEIITQLKATDYVKSEPRGPGSRKMNEVAKCLSKTLTSADLDEQKPRLNFTVKEAFRLTSRAEILYDDPGRFSEELVVFDECDNRYHMNISNHDTGSLRRFHVNTEWEIYAKHFDLKEGDILEIYRFLDHRLVPGRFYYALKLIRKTFSADSIKSFNVRDGSYSSTGPFMCFCFAKNLTSHEVNPKGPVLYLSAHETSTLLDSSDIITSPDSVSLPKKLNVFDIHNNLYIMLLSPCVRFGWTVYSITTGWDTYVSHRNLVPGDEVSFHRSREKDSYYNTFNYILAKKSDKLGYVKSESLVPGSSARDAYGTTIVLDPIISNPNSVAVQNEIRILDIDKGTYKSSFGVRLVRFKSNPGQDLQFAISMCHKNFAAIVTFKVDGSWTHVAYVWKEISPLSTFDKDPLKRFKTLDYPSNVFMCLCETHRRFFRDLILSIVFVHNSGRSLGGFSIHNISVVDDYENEGVESIVFWGVMYYKKNRDRTNADFTSIATVVKTIVPSWENIFLIEDLVNKLEGFNSKKDIGLITNHLALLSSEEQLGFIRNCAEKKPPQHYDYYGDYLKALKGMGENTGWSRKYKKKKRKWPRLRMF